MAPGEDVGLAGPVASPGPPRGVSGDDPALPWAGATVPPPRPPRRRRTWLWPVAFLLAVLGTVAALGGWYLWQINRAVREIPRQSLLPTGPRPSEIDLTGASRTGAATGAPVVGPPQNYLLLGSDARSGTEQGRSDVIMIAHLPADRRHVYLVSIPRDLWVPIPGHGQAKVNAAYSLGGAPLVGQTLEQLLQVRIHHTALMTFEGYVALTDALGGVEVDNKVAGRWQGYDFPRGTITVRGEQALAYVRERHDLPGGDLDRNQRQRAVTRAVLEKLLGAGVLSNPGRFAEVTGLLKEFIVFDETLTDATLRDAVWGLKVTSAADVVTMSAPVGPPAWSPDGQWIWQLDADAMGALADALRHDTMGSYAAARGSDPTLPPTPTAPTTR